MKFLNNIRLKTKLFAVVFFLIGVSVSISTTVYIATKGSIESATTAQIASERVSVVRNAMTEVLAYARAVEFLPLELPEEKRREFEAVADAELKTLLAHINNVKPMVEAGRVAIQSARETLERYAKEVHIPARDLARANKLDDATKIAFVGADMITDVSRKLATIEERNEKWQREAVAKMRADQDALLDTILMIAVTGSLLGLLAAFTTIIFGITKPLMKIIEAMHYLASGKTDRDVEGTDRGDEIGGMAQAVATFRENALERHRLEVAARRERDAESQRQKRTDALITNFRGAIGTVRSALDDQLIGMKSSSEALTRIAMDAADGASSAQTASSEASSNVGDVANAAGELTAASREISTQVHLASECVTRAMSVAQEADAGISSLADLADRIGAIVHMINGIAEQTNMLALNATIEAARAGDAGRSFAVVASEVKTLAGQTAKATEEIGQQVSAIQTATQGAVQLIRTISVTVSDIQGRTTAIAAAVEEQEASTHEISRSISLASSGSERVASDVSSMATSVEKTSDEASQLRSTSERLAQVAGELSQSVESFLEGVTQDVADRRKASRRASRELVIIDKGAKRISTRAVDISETGLRVECEIPLRVKEAVEVEFLNGDRVKATVAWCANGQAGLQMDQRLPHVLIEAMAA